jgi:hypothetical protein
MDKQIGIVPARKWNGPTVNDLVTLVQDHVPWRHYHVVRPTIVIVQFQRPINVDVLGHVDNGRVHETAAIYRGIIIMIIIIGRTGVELNENRVKSKKPRPDPKSSQRVRDGKRPSSVKARQRTSQASVVLIPVLTVQSSTMMGSMECL